MVSFVVAGLGAMPHCVVVATLALLASALPVTDGPRGTTEAVYFPLFFDWPAAHMAPLCTQDFSAVSVGVRVGSVF
jgi:hypothetical protein